MRNKRIFSIVGLAVLLLAGGFYLHQRVYTPVPIALPSRSAIKLSIRSARTEVIAAPHSVRPQTELVFADSHGRDVRLATIRTIIDVKADTLSRQKAVRSLPRDLLPEYSKILTDFLIARHAEDDRQTGYVLKNDIMDALVGQKTPGLSLADLFIGIYEDKAQNIVIRDYAVQHLALLSERLDRPIAWDVSLIQAQQKLIQDSLFKCAEARDSSMSGTALLGLTAISETHSEVDRDRLGQAAVAMAGVGVDEAARVTAFQVCARLQVSNALPVTVNAAQTDPNSIIRVSAIGALGLFGHADDIPILNQIAENSSRLRPVTALAIKRIQERTR